MLLQLLDEGVTGLVLPLLAKYDGSLYHHASDVVGHTSDGALHNSGVGHQGTLYLERTDAVARTLDHIIDTALKPVIAVLITPSHVTCMINAIVPCLACLLLVAVIALEQADGLTVAYTDHNLAFLTVFTGGAVGTEQINIILGIGDTH